ncbi:T-complex protein 1 subunit eta, partial [Symbiodinium microadriaticum]
MKQGTIRRLLGNARAITASIFISTVAMAGAALQAVPFGSQRRPDVLEIFEDSAQMSSNFSRWGLSVHDPIDIKGDLSDEDGRDRLMQWIDESQPRLVVMSNCCPYRPPVYAMHRNLSQAQRRERRWRERQKRVVDFIEHVFDRQLKRGDHAMAEVPFGEQWGVKTLADNMMRHPRLQCAHGWGWKEQDGRHSVWIVSSNHIFHQLEKSRAERQCEPTSLDHRVSAEHWKRDFGRAICKGFILDLKESDPGRLRKLLRSLAARIRNRVHSGNRPVTDLRWSEKMVMRSLEKWSAVFAQEGEETGERDDEDEEMIPVLEEPNPRSSTSSGDGAVEQPAPPRQAVQSGLSSNGICFEVPPGRRLQESVKHGLIKVQLDCICVHDAARESHWFLSIIDRATSYHAIELLRDHSPAELYRAFDRGWMKWAGPPLRATTDLEGGFQGKDFWIDVGNAGTALSSIAGTAHWQAGKVERHNQTIKDMLHKTIRHTQVKGREDMRKMGREVAWAKNSLVREHGWSPVALVFGREPRVFGELHSGGNPASYHPSVGDPGSDVAVRMRFRYHAKLEFVKSQARQMLLRTAHNRTRRLPIPRIGQLVFFWRAENSKKRASQSKWVGPGYVVGIQDRNAWVTCGGRCFLVAGEHLREAIGDEQYYGDPELQKALALFKKIPGEATYEDLLGQPDPEGEPRELEQEPLAQDVSEDMDVDDDVDEGKTQSKTKLKRMMEKEIPFDLIPSEDRELYRAAEEKDWFIGDISNAFLQGAPLDNKPDMFMRQPKQGLKGLQTGQILKLLKPVYGRPDAPRAWYNELSRILENELGFCKSQVDPALFFLRDCQGKLRALLIVHVDDVMICHDGSSEGHGAAEKLHNRFPFGTWNQVAKEEAGVSYCGKEIKVVVRNEETCVVLSQNAFLEGRLQAMTIEPSRAKQLDLIANETELTDYRSVVGSLQWLAVQSRPDLAFECNQLQKRVSDLRVRDLHRANRAVKDAVKHRCEILFRPLGADAEIVTFHDAGLYSSVGVEIDERQCEDILQNGSERKLVYSQKGVCVGFVKRGATEHEQRAHYNLIDWKSSTNRRVIESSFAAETHGALMGHNMSRFAQVLLAEIRYGSEIISAVEDDGWQDLCPVTLVTDCKSIYDTVHKDGQHVGEKGNIVHAVLLRQLLSTRGGGGKARLLWVPTRCQVADGLTKGARGGDIREQLKDGLLFHEKAQKKRLPSTGKRLCELLSGMRPLVADYKTFFAEMSVDAISLLGDDMSVSSVGIKKVTGGSVTDTLLVPGVCFKKCFSYAGFEQQPKRFENAKILLLNLELELKAEKDNAEVRISDPDQYQSIVDAEWNIIYEKLDLIAKSGANVVLSRLAIGDLATQYFADRNIFCAGRVEVEDLERTRRATGAEVQTTAQGITESVLGSCGLFEERQMGAE